MTAPHLDRDDTDRAPRPQAPPLPRLGGILLGRLVLGQARLTPPRTATE